MEQTLRGGLIGCGYFARNHLNAWQEVDGVEIVAVCDLDATRAQTLAAQHHVPHVYTDALHMMDEQRPDFVDIVTTVGSHRSLVELAASQRIHAICQKPLAATLEDASAMVDACARASVTFMVHENFRWIPSMQQLKQLTSQIGDLFYGQISFRSARDVFTAQPYLATDERFILADVGVHTLDLARFFLGEARWLACVTRRINPAIRGEDVATVLLEMRSGATCIVDLSYASRMEVEYFPQTLVHLEGSDGTVTLSRDYWFTVVDRNGVRKEQSLPPIYNWSTPPSESVQASVVAVQRHWVDCLRNGIEPQMSGRDNLKTLELAYGAYESAASGQTVYTRLP